MFKYILNNNLIGIVGHFDLDNIGLIIIPRSKSEQILGIIREI